MTLPSNQDQGPSLKMSNPVSDDSSLDFLLNKYGSSKQSVQNAELGESSAEGYQEEHSSREAPSQFLKEIRERAQILSQNAVKSRKTALQNVINDKSATSTSGSSLDLFVDVIQSADIQEDKVSSSHTSRTEDEAMVPYTEDVLLQPVVPLDSVPWSLEGEDSLKTCPDYYKGLSLEPWGVPTTDTFEENDSEESVMSENEIRAVNNAGSPDLVPDQDDLLDVDFTTYAPSISRNQEENTLNSVLHFDVQTKTVGNWDREGGGTDEDDTSINVRTDDLDVCFDKLASLALRTEDVNEKENKEESESDTRFLGDKIAPGAPVSSVDSSSNSINFESNVEKFQLGGNTDTRSDTSLSLQLQLSDKAVILSSDDGLSKNPGCDDSGSFDFHISPTPVQKQQLQDELDAKTPLSCNKELNNKPTEVASYISEKTVPHTFHTRAEEPVDSSNRGFMVLERFQPKLDDRGVDSFLDNKEKVKVTAQKVSLKSKDEHGPIDNKGKICDNADSHDISDKLKSDKLFKVSKFNGGPQLKKPNTKEFLRQINAEDQGAESSEKFIASSPPVENPKPYLGQTDGVTQFMNLSHEPKPETSGKSWLRFNSQGQQRNSRYSSGNETDVHSRKRTETRICGNPNGHDVKLGQSMNQKDLLVVNQGECSSELKSPGNVRSLIALFNHSERVNLSPRDSPRSPKVFNWSVLQSTKTRKTEETVFSFSSTRRDLEKRPPQSPVPVSSNDETQDVPWMRELRERKRRRQQQMMQGK